MATDDEFLQATLPALDLAHNLARRFARGRADAEDLVQDTYLRAWQAWTTGTRPRRAEPWLATNCLNLGRDRLRRATLRSEVAVERSGSRPPTWTWRRPRSAGWSGPRSSGPCGRYPGSSGSRSPWAARHAGASADRPSRASTGRVAARGRPQPLRERVRASVTAASRSDRRRRRRPLVAVAVAVVALAAVAGGLLARQGGGGPGQPAVIAAAAATYRTGQLDGSAASPARPRVRRAGDLVWQGARLGRLAGLPVVAHDYRDAAGQRVTLLLAGHSFPEARGADHPPGTAIWVAEVNGVAVLCADRPSPSLLVAGDRAQALQAAARLGLH